MAKTHPIHQDADNYGDFQSDDGRDSREPEEKPNVEVRGHVETKKKPTVAQRQRKRDMERALAAPTSQQPGVKPRATRKSQEDEQEAFFHDRRYDPKRPFSQDAMADYERDFAAGLNPYLKAAMSPKYDLTAALLDTLYRRLVETRKNYIITVSGEMGYGKSAFGMGFYKIVRDMMDLPYSIKHVLFTEDDLKAANIKARDTLIVDEDFKFGYGIGLTSLNNFIDYLSQTIRYEQVNLVFIGPSDVQSVAHRRFRILDYNTRTLESRALVHSNNEWAGVEYIGNVRIKGWVIPRIGTEPGYEDIKAQFTQKVLHDDVRSHNKALVIVADKLIAENNILAFAQRAQKGIIRIAYGQLSEKQIDGVLEILMAKKAVAMKDGTLKEDPDVKQAKEEKSGPDEKDGPDAPLNTNLPPKRHKFRPRQADKLGKE